MTDAQGSKPTLSISSDGDTTIGGDVAGRDIVTIKKMVSNNTYFLPESATRETKAFTSIKHEATGPDVRRAVRQWLRKQLLVDHVHIESLEEVRMFAWPVALCSFQCQAMYRTRRSKVPGRIPRKFVQEDWETVELPSPTIPVTLCVPAWSNGIAVNEAAIMEKAVSAINGFIPRVEIEWNKSLTSKASKLVYEIAGKTSRWFVEQVKRSALGFSQSDSSPTILWPDLAKARRSLGLFKVEQPKPADTEAALGVFTEHIIRQARATVDQELSRIIKSASDDSVFLSTKNYSNESVFAFLYPLWVLRASPGGMKLRLIIDGLSNEVVHASIPLSAISKWRATALTALVLALMSTALVILTTLAVALFAR